MGASKVRKQWMHQRSVLVNLCEVNLLMTSGYPLERAINVVRVLFHAFFDLCAGNSPGTGEFPAQMASNAENVSIR